MSTVSVKLKTTMMNCGIVHPNFYVINNLVDFSVFCPETVSQENERKVFSHISCFDDGAKNISGIIRTLRHLATKRNDFLCLMVGDGIDRKEIEQLAHDLVMRNLVQFTGMLEGVELVRIYRKSMFTVLFSNFENMPVVIPESFACGKPVIATRVGGIPEFVNEENGILVDAGNEQELEEAIVFMFDHIHSFDSGKIRDQAEKRFGTQAIHDQLMMLYSHGKKYHSSNKLLCLQINFTFPQKGDMK